MGPFRRDPADTRPIDRTGRSPLAPTAPRERPAPPAAVQEALF
jgi:hypothetical protein